MAIKLKIRNRPLALLICGLGELALVWLLAKSWVDGRIGTQTSYLGVFATNQIAYYTPQITPIRYYGVLVIMAVIAIGLGRFIVAVIRS